MYIGNIDIPDEVVQTMQLLENGGFEAYIVGGCVRDSIMHRIPHDWDICTSATPDEMKRVFGGFQTIDTGIQHGTVTVVVNSMNIEVTTYRIDGMYSDGRHPDSVQFTSSLVEDLQRRDFTMNAIAVNLNGVTVDPFNGVVDISNKVIRCVGYPFERFEEDPLRILRALRFQAQLGFVMESQTHDEMYNGHLIGKLMTSVSKERICSEFIKMVVSDGFSTILATEPHLMAVMTPCTKASINFDQNNPYHWYPLHEYTSIAMKFLRTNDPITRIALYFHDCGKPMTETKDSEGVSHYYGHGAASANLAKKVMMDLRMDNDTIEKVYQLVFIHDVYITPSMKSIKRVLNRMDAINRDNAIEQFNRLLFIKEADICAQNMDYMIERIEEIGQIRMNLEQIIKSDHCFTRKDLAINGKDLIEMGIPEGKDIGILLDCVLEEVMNEAFPNDHDVLCDLIRDDGKRKKMIKEYSKKVI